MKVLNKVGDLVVQYSTFLILDDSQKRILIDYTADNGFEIKLGFVFTNDFKTMKQKMDSHNEDDRKIITCQNFNGPMGSGINEPILVAEVAGKKIYLLFWIYGFGSSKKIEYEFLTEE